MSNDTQDSSVRTLVMDFYVTSILVPNINIFIYLLEYTFSQFSNWTYYLL